MWPSLSKADAIMAYRGFEFSNGFKTSDYFPVTEYFMRKNQERPTSKQAPSNLRIKEYSLENVQLEPAPRMIRIIFERIVLDAAQVHNYIISVLQNIVKTQNSFGAKKTPGLLALTRVLGYELSVTNSENDGAHNTAEAIDQRTFSISASKRLRQTATEDERKDAHLASEMMQYWCYWLYNQQINNTSIRILPEYVNVPNMLDKLCMDLANYLKKESSVPSVAVSASA